MTLKVFNSLGREKQEFKPIHPGKVHMYTCGPTVYDLPHIGNYRSFFMGDMIRRYLEYKGYEVKYVMNITDIDDKTIRDSGKAGMTLKEFTEKYTKVFLDGIGALNIKRATIYPKATEHIPDMIKLIEKLIEKGYAYVVNGSVYYSIRKFKDYGKLSQVDLSRLDIGHTVDVDEYEKDEPADFALWKRSTQEEIERGIYFESPWGKGRPGWHIECSTMSMKYLGETFDIHTGGIDLLFPHHENEIAQSEAATGKKFVNYWLHGEHLLVNGAKMSKSKGNYFTLTDLLKKYNYNEIRYLFLSTHYRDKLNYTEKAMENARNGARKLKNTLENLYFTLERATDETFEHDKELLKKLENHKKEFEQAMDDDFDTPKALRVIHELASDINKYITKANNRKVLEKARETFELLLHTFGLFERGEGKEVVKLEPELMQLIQKREELRRQKKYEEADKIREELRKRGIQLDDTPYGVRWKRIETN